MGWFWNDGYSPSSVYNKTFTFYDGKFDGHIGYTIYFTKNDSNFENFKEVKNTKELFKFLKEHHSEDSCSINSNTFKNYHLYSLEEDEEEDNMETITGFLYSDSKKFSDVVWKEVFKKDIQKYKYFIPATEYEIKKLV